MMDESSYRKKVDAILSQLDQRFERVDPDLAESEYSQGTLVITFMQAHKLILSPQTPLRQIWAAFRDRAWHFGLDPASDRWLDDKTHDEELLGLVGRLTREQAGVSLAP